MLRRARSSPVELGRKGRKMPKRSGGLEGQGIPIAHPAEKKDERSLI
jgi:hypothetical protein